eukprot:935301_1
MCAANSILSVAFLVHFYIYFLTATPHICHIQIPSFTRTNSYILLLISSFYLYTQYSVFIHFFRNVFMCPVHDFVCALLFIFIKPIHCKFVIDLLFVLCSSMPKSTN